MELVLLTDYRGFLRQGIKQYLTMDKKILYQVFNENGVEILEYSYEDLINRNIELENRHIIYTSSQNLEYKSYIDDILYSLSKKNTLLPRYEIFRSHENKGYQEILKKELSISSLLCYYFANRAGLEKNINLISKYPLILKKLHGAGSTNVYKVNSYEELMKLVSNINRPFNYKIKLIKKYIKKYIIRRKYIPSFYDEDDFFGRFVLQEFMEGLTEDWKVLIFGKKYYVLNRKIRDNDFRASGSGKLSFIEAPKEVLEYAASIFQKLDVPFVSLDIAYNGKECNLIEFQGTHFGPYTLINSNWYYEYSDGNWTKIEKSSVLEEEYALSILQYIKQS